MNKTVSLKVADNTAMNAYVSMPDGNGPYAAIMVFQEAFGVNKHIRDIADRLATEGYLAIAPELFHRTAEPGFEGGYDDFSVLMPHFSAISTETLEADVKAVYEWLQQQENVQKDKTGCIGFCLGGRVAFIANTCLPIQAAVSYYGGGLHTVVDRADKMSAPQVFFWGGKDKHILPEHVQTVNNALAQAGKDYINVTISYADHAFNNNDRAAYHAQASAEAWGMTMAFLKNKLG
jgi:carboxymethylenebutenolidase